MRYVILFLSITLLSPLGAQVGLGLAPMRLELPLAPGAVHSGALDLTNEAEAATRVRAELLDFHIDESTTPQFARNLPQEASNSCRAWLTVNPMEFEAESKLHSIIRYTIRVPADAKAKSYYCAAGFTALPRAEQLKQTGLRTTVRVVAVFYVIVGQPSTLGQISGLSYESALDAKGVSRRVVVVSLRNDGDYYFRPTGEISLLGDDGRAVEVIQLPSFPVLPRREQRFVLPVTQASSVEVKMLRAKVDIGNHEIQEATIQVAPPSEAR
jgi:hypothetical protein